MHSQYLEKLSAEDYKTLKQKLFDIQSGICFICGKKIDIDVQDTDIDHVTPLNLGGKDSDINFALTHSSCNRSKQDANLEVARALHKLMAIQEKVQTIDKRQATLKDVLINEAGSKFDFSYRVDGSDITYSFDKIGDKKIYKSPIFKDNLSGEDTCFIEVPIEYLYHDELINPRGINSSINLLVKEFYKRNPQLHLSLARIVDGKIMVFDGQHKAVAQILLGVKKILVRLFINPDVNRLTETNANAGSKLRQIAFDKAIMRQLNNTQYAEKIKAYQKQHSLDENNFSFSEQNLCDFFKGEKMKTYIIDALKSSITSSSDNKMKDYIDFEGKGKSLPISHSTYDKVFLSKFIDSKRILTTPISSDSENNPRELEIKQISRLLSLITEKIYVGKFDENIGLTKIEDKIVNGRDTDITDNHLVAYRMSKEEILYAWTPFLMKIIEMYFLNNGIIFEKGSVFQTQFSDQLWHNLERFIISLSELPLWKDRSMAGTHFSGKKNQEFWKNVFEKGKTPEGVQVISSPINYMEMMK